MEKNFDKTQIDPQVLNFIELLLDKADMTDLPEDILANMLMDLYSRFINFAFLSILQEMSEDKYQEFDEFMATKPDAMDVEHFLKNKVPNFSDSIQKSMSEFENTYLEVMK